MNYFKSQVESFINFDQNTNQNVLVKQDSWLSSVQSLSCVQLSATPWTAACQVFLPITNSQSLFKLIIKLVIDYILLMCINYFQIYFSIFKKSDYIYKNYN